MEQANEPKVSISEAANMSRAFTTAELVSAGINVPSRSPSATRHPKAAEPPARTADAATARPVVVRMPGFKLANTLNVREHPLKRARREDAERKRAALYLLATVDPPPTPCVVGLVRVYAGRAQSMDDDGLAAAFKAIRDSVAKWLGCDDSAKAPVVWLPEERRGDEDAVEVLVVPVTALPRMPRASDFLPASPAGRDGTEGTR